MVAFGGEGQAAAGLEVPSDPDPVSQTYTVEATVTDRAGNPHTASVTVAHQPP